MLKNNAIALVGHVVVLIIYFVIGIPLGVIFAPRGYETMLAISILVVSVICWFTYMLWGYHFITPQDTKIKNLLSVSVLGILGSIIGGLDFGLNVFSSNLKGIVC